MKRIRQFLAAHPMLALSLLALAVPLVLYRN